MIVNTIAIAMTKAFNIKTSICNLLGGAQPWRCPSRAAMDSDAARILVW